MADTIAETLTELERQAESRRAELAQTVDELHNRVSPGAIKADVRNFARGRMQVLEEWMRENPLQAVAIATGFAYPLWRIMGRIPAPLLMISAGLALSRRGHGDNHGAPRRPADAFDDPGVHGVSAGRQGITEKLSDAASGAVERASETIKDVRGMASEKMENLADTLSEGYQSGREAAVDAASRIEDTYKRTRDSVSDLLERHPMLAGAAAFAVGGLLASSLPVTRQEHRLLGDTSDDIKQRTQDLASESLEHATAAAKQIYEETASQLREQGLTPDAAANTVQHTVEAARDAVERTMAAAGGAQPKDGSSRSPRSP
jgi:ElaB/YqjD/DUF883 family membrane-anchored ribosome-binding protein